MSRPRLLQDVQICGIIESAQMCHQCLRLLCSCNSDRDSQAMDVLKIVPISVSNLDTVFL